MHIPLARSFHQLCIVAQQGRPDQIGLHCLETRRFGTIRCDLTLGRIARTGHQIFRARCHNPACGHFIAGQRPGLVRTDHRRGPKGFDRRQPAHHRIPSRHALHSNRQCDRDDRRQSFGDDADGQRHHNHQRIRPWIAAQQNGKGKQRSSQADCEPGDQPAELIDLAQQRRGLGLHLPDQRGDAADFGIRPGGDRDTRRLARGDQRAGIQHTDPVAQWRIQPHNRLALDGRQRFPGQDGFIRQHVAGPDQPQVGRGFVARLNHDNIADHNLARINLVALAAPQHRRMRRDHVTDCGQRLFCLALLQKADDRVDHNHRDNHARIDEVAQKPCRRCRRQQEIDQHIVELCQKAQNRTGARRGWQLVRTIDLQAADRLGCVQPLGACFQRCENFGRR